MNKPKSIKISVITLWILIFASSLIALIEKMLGLIGLSVLIFSLFIYGFLCILPYKINNGSNAARYVYLVLSLMTTLLFIGILKEIKTYDLVFNLISVFAEVFVIYNLFKPESNSWFSSLKN
jgi:hypothetical protein